MTNALKRGRLFAAALVLLVIGLIVAVAWLAIDLGSRVDTREAQDAALSAARQAAIDLTTNNYKTIDADYAKVESDGTERFRGYFDGAKADSKALVVALQQTSKGSVLEAVAQATDDSHVTALIFVRQGTFNTKQPTGVNSLALLKMSMVKQGSRWLLDDLSTQATN